MTITDHPLHGSGRAELPHPALASGDDAKSPQRIGVAYASGWQPAVNKPLHPFPCDSTVLAPPSEDVMPEACDLETECVQGMAVHGHSVIVEVSSDNRTQPFPHRRYGVMHAPLEVSFHCLQFRLQPLTNRLPKHRESTITPLLPADVREAEKVEGLGLSQSGASSIFDRERTEFDEPRLFGMQLQSKLPKSLGQLRVKSLGIRSVLKSEEVEELFNEVVNTLEAEVTANLADQMVIGPIGKKYSFSINSFAKDCLINGLDSIGWTEQYLNKISSFEEKLKKQKPWL